jgi:DNA-binding XRE family transcriptional regulator
MMVATPEAIAAAWETWRSRHGGKLGPGPAFREAIDAALAKMKLTPAPQTHVQADTAAAIEDAYGILWLVVSDDPRVHEARKRLLSLLDKDGQKRGIQVAKNLFGAPTEADMMKIDDALTYAEQHGELRRLREVRGLGIGAMAAEIGISPATLHRAEAGETVSVEVAGKLGPYLGKCLCCGQLVGPPANPLVPASIRDALWAIRQSVKNARGAIESNQVVDKDVHGTLTRVIAQIDAALDDAHAVPPAQTQKIIDEYEALQDRPLPDIGPFIEKSREVLTEIGRGMSPPTPNLHVSVTSALADLELDRLNQAGDDELRSHAENVTQMRMRLAVLLAAVEGIDADYMTSENHHPGYVLIPTAKFEAIRVAITAAKASE